MALQHTVGTRILRHTNPLSWPQRLHSNTCARGNRLLARVSQPVEQMAQRWLALDKQPESRAVIQQLLDQGNEAALQDMLGQRLEFGTAGLRGKMAPGFNRMNAVTVQQTAQGLCRHLQHTCPDLLAESGIVIGYDGRHHSLEFAHLTAAVFLSQGLPVHLFPRVVPTPFVAAGMAVLRCAAGVMVTASHNPKEYNGYKVYASNGCQIIPPLDEQIAAAIESNLDLWPLPEDLASYVSNKAVGRDGRGLLRDPSQRVSEEYYRRLEGLRFRSREANGKAARVVYTPLHGVGLGPLLRAFEVFGLPPPHVVAQQAQPDPEFPTVAFPNPEEGQGTWELAFRLGSEVGAQLVVANDPDADRLAVAERCPAAPGGWRPFTGNEIGALLAHWLWSNVRRREPEFPPGRYSLLASTVSSRLLGAMAAREGFDFQETLTGFKWLGNVALGLEQAGQQVLFAYEEAIGFMLGPMFKDKDGVSAAAVFAEMAAEVYSQGGTLSALLQDLSARYGHFAYRANYFVADRPEKSRAVFDRLRQGGRYPKALAGLAITGVRDLGTGLDSRQPDGKARLPWRAGDMMITFYIEGGATLTLRASGTEPKLKYYLEVVAEDAATSASLADRLVKGVVEDLVMVEKHGMAFPKH